MMQSAIKKQYGAVLAFCLVMLLLLTLAGTRMIQQNKQQLEIANSARLLTQEFANAEGILAEAKNVINYQPAHDNCLPYDPRSCTDHSYFILDPVNEQPDTKGRYKHKLPINDPIHQCTPTISAKQNILLAGTELFKDIPILKETVNGLPRAAILEVRCRSEDGDEQICSSYVNNSVKCQPKSGDKNCSGKTIDDITIEEFNSVRDLCYQIYDPQDLRAGSESYPGKNTKCPKEIYKIQVISTDAYGTTRQIVSDHVVGCG